jgi:hypothetical protein
MLGTTMQPAKSKACTNQMSTPHLVVVVLQLRLELRRVAEVVPEGNEHGVRAVEHRLLAPLIQDHLRPLLQSGLGYHSEHLL